MRPASSGRWHSDAGFASLFAAGLATTTNTPLHILRLAGDRTDAELRDVDALEQARQLIVDNDIATYDHTTSGDPIATAVKFAAGASAIVILAGLAITGAAVAASAGAALHDRTNQHDL